MYNSGKQGTYLFGMFSVNIWNMGIYLKEVENFLKLTLIKEKQEKHLHSFSFPLIKFTEMINHSGAIWFTAFLYSMISSGNSSLKCCAFLI